MPIIPVESDVIYVRVLQIKHESRTEKSNFPSQVFLLTVNFAMDSQSRSRIGNDWRANQHQSHLLTVYSSTWCAKIR